MAAGRAAQRAAWRGSRRRARRAVLRPGSSLGANAVRLATADWAQARGHGKEQSLSCGARAARRSSPGRSSGSCFPEPSFSRRWRSPKGSRRSAPAAARRGSSTASLPPPSQPRSRRSPRRGGSAGRSSSRGRASRRTGAPGRSRPAPGPRHPAPDAASPGPPRSWSSRWRTRGESEDGEEGEGGWTTLGCRCTRIIRGASVFEAHETSGADRLRSKQRRCHGCIALADEYSGAQHLAIRDIEVRAPSDLRRRSDTEVRARSAWLCWGCSAFEEPGRASRSPLASAPARGGPLEGLRPGRRRRKRREPVLGNLWIDGRRST